MCREAKWDRIMGLREVGRLRRARDLLAVRGFDTRDAVLTCLSGAGFSPELLSARTSELALVGLDELYAL